jgi:hypothetical protein
LNYATLLNLSILFQTFVPLSTGVGLALAAVGKRRRRSAEEEQRRATDWILDNAKASLENNLERFVEKLNLMYLQ